ncbi:hypothetical protein [Pseudomonas sp. CGJS7]|uniref:hypothetical protein n=1 Tax=Pseudomonas sp. CGJS7 TaxID=3109348 RepID=UPI00300BA41A
MTDWLALLEDRPWDNPANFIDGVYVCPAMAAVIRARARMEAEKEAHAAAVAERAREAGGAGE